MNINTSDIIPLYLADNLSLPDAVYSASTLPSTQILLSVLKESKSLPRETDTNPTSPTPDLPGPAQEKLLTFIRELQGPSPRLSTSQSETRYGVGNAESGIGLDALDDTDEKTRRDEEEYSLIQETVLAALPHPAVSPVDVDNRRRSVFDEEEIIIDDGSASARADNTRREQRETRRHSSSGSPSTWRSTQGRRRRSTIQRLEGLEKQFLNLISFLAFLTKDYLLLSPGVGERVAAEMIRDTLAHHSFSTSSSSPPGKHLQKQKEQDASTPAWFGSGSPICVAGVALWLVIMGEELFERLRKASSRSASSGSKGFTPRKARGIPGGGATGLGSAAAVAVATEVVRDWETYITRLQFLSLREDLGIDARELAAEAAAVMRRVGS